MRIISARICLLIYLLMTFTLLTRSADEYYKPFKKDNITGVGTTNNTYTWNNGAAIERFTQVPQLFKNDSVIYHENTTSIKNKYGKRYTKRSLMS